MAAATQDYRVKELLRVGDSGFGKRDNLLSLWQEIAENFYVERADFTSSRSMGKNFADNLSASYPILARRDLGNMFSSMLRPRDRKWFSMKAGHDDSVDNENDRWLEWATELQRRAMYDRVSGFVRATKEGDHDFAAFGQAVISTQMNWRDTALRYKCHHLRDTVWFEDHTGEVERVDYKWKPTIHQLMQMFGEKNLHPKMKIAYAKDPYMEVECRHTVVPSEQYESSQKEYSSDRPKRYKQPFVSVYMDVENCHILEEVGSWTRIYTVPRWQTVSGSQYAYSPATVAALPDARLFQSIALTILEAGEKYTNPPLIGVQEAIRGDVNLFAGGITYVDEKYDERLGEVLRPLYQDRGGFDAGIKIQEQVRAAIHESFFLNKINLPNRGSAEMTALETAQRVQEYVRDALPLFEPAEQDYNASLCEITFETLSRADGFGDPNNIPQGLRGKDIKFNFVSPLHNAEDSLKGQRFGQAQQMIAQAMALDPSSASLVDIRFALRDAMKGVGVPSNWINSEEVVNQKDQAAAEEAAVQKTMALMQGGADIAKTTGEAATSFSSLPQ